MLPLRAKTLRHGWIELALVWAVFVAHAGLVVPEVNEPNYLSKARHYWTPGWCPSDFFLNSADAHLVFYWTCGWLAAVLSLPAAAVVGRVATYALLAWGWQRLSSAVAPGYLLAGLSALLMVGLNHWCQMAGEWVVGGFEAKGFAYALVFFGAAALVRNQWNRAWIFLGAATALHVLVGGWSMVAAGAAWCCLRGDDQRPALRSMLPGLATGSLLAAVGLWPALRLGHGIEPLLAEQAASIQVFRRLPHHLNPDKFFFQSSPPLVTNAALRFLLLVAAWTWLSQRARPRVELRRLTALVGGSLVIALLGIVAAVLLRQDPQLAARVLRFYWFRLADVLVPAGAAITIAYWIGTQGMLRPAYRRGWLVAALLAGLLHVGQMTSRRYLDRRPAADAKFCKSQEVLDDWIDTCRFVDRSTPAGAVFLTPRGNQTFKWYAGRSEVVTWKEMPQDARSIVAWWDRIQDLQQTDADGRVSLSYMSVAELRALANRYNAQFLLTEAEPALDLPVLHRNNSFAVYRIAP